MRKILISIIIILLSPLIVNADVDYEITDYYIESHILENGDMKIKELFVLDGSFNGYERDIVYTNYSLDIFEDEMDFSNSAIYNADGIYDVSIKAKYIDAVDFTTMNSNNFNDFTSVSYANLGDKAKYVKSYISGGERYRMYYPADYESVAFYITYTIDNAVVIHNDVAELYWNFIGTDYADDINNLNIKLYLPDADNSNNFRIWAHGDLTGEINYLDGRNGLIATMDKVDAYDAVDIRTTFDKSLIKDQTELDKSNVNALEKIIEVETDRAEVANALRKELKTKYTLGVIATVVYYIGLLITFIYVKKKYGTSKKSDFTHEYNREFIDDYNVEVIDYLLNKNNISPNAMSASIMNLIYKKNIKAEKIENEKKSKEDYKFVLLNEENINRTEQELINFLFKKIGKVDENNMHSFTTIELRDYASRTRTYEKFISSYTTWKSMVIKDGKEQQFYEPSPKARKHGVIWFILGILLSIFIMVLDAVVPLSGVAPFIAVVFLIYTLLVNKKTEKGALHYDKWMAFKRFLKDFGNFKDKELPEIILWERYLVYAVIFGIADKVQKDMNVKIKEIELSGNVSYPTMTDIYIYHHIADSVHYSVNHAIRESYQKQAATRAAASSSHSSGGGFGGGFSSGGGFGGGGGGGRGF